MTMFATKIYVQRRNVLKKKIGSGLLLFLGNDDSPMNYRDNTYTFRQDSTFLYYWGLDDPSLAAVIDLDGKREIIFGNDPTVDEIVWTGPQTLIKEKSHMVGVSEAMPLGKLEEVLWSAVKQGRPVHYLRPYRPENILKIERLLGIHPRVVSEYASKEFIRAVVEQRSVKAKEEIEQIELAIDVTRRMQMTAMKMSKPGIYEREVAGAMEGIAVSMGGNLSFPIIFSIHGETLHNHYHGNKMKAGNIVVNDSGAESSLHYAGDITRTFPVSGKFTAKQKEIYQIVLDAQRKAIGMVSPGVKYKDVHLAAGKVLAEGLKDLGLMKGDMEEAVQAGAHALFFQCGLGHMMGLDVHDMEDLGEEYVGYDAQTKRNSQFGLCYLRLAKPLQPGYVLTVEPGIYFIPELIHAWKAEKKFAQFVNYDAVSKYERFGGMRVEDDVLVLQKGNRVLGKKIPKTIAEVEALMAR
jgi:Xaa-Pro aminopeptidase